MTDLQTELAALLDEMDEEWRAGGFKLGYSQRAFIAERLASAFVPVELLQLGAGGSHGYVPVESCYVFARPAHSEEDAK